jgi:hypothetical protein
MDEADFFLQNKYSKPTFEKKKMEVTHLEAHEPLCSH